jgi:Heterokaryon incompatibility protein (HET)
VNRGVWRSWLRSDVDLLCINQDDVQERISQVQKMALIYLRAARVLARIGHDDGAETASRLIKKLREVLEEAWEETDDLCLRQVIDAQDQADLEFVVRMFRKPLFSRVWFIQELGVARAITFLYGDFEIDWVDLVSFVNCMMDSQDLYQLEHYTDYEKFCTAFSSFREGLHKDEQLPGFLEVLHMGRNYGASDHRDHVFALLGHPSADNDGSPIIRADYTKPVSHNDADPTATASPEQFAQAIICRSP